MLGNWRSWSFTMILWLEECAAGWTPLLWEGRLVSRGMSIVCERDWPYLTLPYHKIFSQLYIMTLGCLAPYRRLGIGTKMLEHVLKVVQEDGNFASIFLHVQINNQSAIEFYKKFGFNIVETKEQYYKVSNVFLLLSVRQKFKPSFYRG